MPATSGITQTGLQAVLSSAARRRRSLASLVTPGRSCEVVRRGRDGGRKKEIVFRATPLDGILIDGGAKRLLHSTPAVSQPLRRPSHIRALPCEPPTTGSLGNVNSCSIFRPQRPRKSRWIERTAGSCEIEVWAKGVVQSGG